NIKSIITILTPSYHRQLTLSLIVTKKTGFLHFFFSQTNAEPNCSKISSVPSIPADSRITRRVTPLLSFSSPDSAPWKVPDGKETVVSTPARGSTAIIQPCEHTKFDTSTVSGNSKDTIPPMPGYQSRASASRKEACACAFSDCVIIQRASVLMQRIDFQAST